MTALTDTGTQTFSNQQLETEFLSYCQLVSPVPWESAQVETNRQAMLTSLGRHFHLADFDSAQAEELVLGTSFLQPLDPNDNCEVWLGSPMPFASLCSSRLLTAAEELSVMRRMHYLKHLARKILAAEDLDPWGLTRAQALIKAAMWHRDLMVRSNMRLVVSIVTKMPVVSRWYDELVSDGSIALLRAVDKFDPGRGYRFSTYANPIIRRECFRRIMERAGERGLYVSCDCVPLLASDINGCDLKRHQVCVGRGHWIVWRKRLLSLLQNLSRRERLIIRSRYCLGAHRRVKTLQRLADALKISKERVRQLESRALYKLRVAAESQSRGNRTAKLQHSRLSIKTRPVL